MPTKKSTKAKPATSKEEVVSQVLPEEVEVTFENKKENPYLIPISVLGAGLLIAMAIIFKDPSGANLTQQKPPADAVKAIGLRNKEFESCIAKKQFDQKIQGHIDDATKSGGGGTPYSIVTAPGGKRFVIAGAYPLEDVKKTIEEALASTETPSDEEKKDAIYNMLPVSPADHILGNPEAPVKIVEFADLQCPFCKSFHETLKQVMAEYGQDGRVAWVYRHLPLMSIHRYALDWAEESECANQIGGSEKFWEYIDARFTSQGE